MQASSRLNRSRRCPTGAAEAGFASRTQNSKIAGVTAGTAGVTAGTGFGKTVGPRISGKIFAFPKDGELILKLPSTGSPSSSKSEHADRGGRAPDHRIVG